MRIKGEWFLQYDEGKWIGPLLNTMDALGLARLAQHFETLPACYIAVGAATEVYRKAVGSVIRSDNLIRFRTVFSPVEGNGSHTWLELFSDATEASGSGTRINHLDQIFSKALGQVLNIECRLTFQQGV